MSIIKARNIQTNSNSDPLVLSTNSTERLRITSAGNVGIGTSSPATALHVSGTATATTVQVSTTATAASFVGNGTIPVGGIIMWSGTTVPSGWALCNGSNGTPNLLDKFIVGAHSDSSGAKTTITGSATQTGGSKDAVLVQHDHAASTGATGSHSHFNFANAISNSAVSTNALTATQSVASTGGGGAGSDLAYGLKPATLPPTVGLTNTAGSHSHTVTVDNAGSSGVDANLPPYYALAFIMRTQ